MLGRLLLGRLLLLAAAAVLAAGNDAFGRRQGKPRALTDAGAAAGAGGRHKGEQLGHLLRAVESASRFDHFWQ